MSIIRRKEVTTLQKQLKKEMERLQKLRDDREDNWWGRDSSNWAREEFGDNLDTITPIAIERNQEYCQICGKPLPLEERYIRLEFSFCDEYDCDMNICKTCSSLMGEQL